MDSIFPKDQAEILFVEDDDADAALTTEALKHCAVACSVTHLTDGAQALEHIASSRLFAGRHSVSEPRLILLDLKLPQIGGLQVLQKLKSDPLTRGIPIVVLTASQTAIELAESYQLGANSYVIKPTDGKEFAKVVGRIAEYWLSINQLPNGF
jgi:two-component system response regulator